MIARLKSHNIFMMGLLMNQISEFSLILCTLCVRAGVLDPTVLTVMTVAAVVSIIISSIGHIFIDQIYEKIQRWRCIRCIDDHHRAKQKHKNTGSTKNAVEMVANPSVAIHDSQEEDGALGRDRAPTRRLSVRQVWKTTTGLLKIS